MKGITFSFFTAVLFLFQMLFGAKAMVKPPPSKPKAKPVPSASTSSCSGDYPGSDQEDR